VIDSAKVMYQPARRSARSLGAAPMRIAVNQVRILHAALLVALSALLSLPAFPAELGDARQVASATQFTIRSEILKEDRVVLIYVPDTYGSESARQKRYPVLYLLDGRAYFEVTTGIAHHLGSWNAAVQWIPDLIVVAIQNTKRTRDMTPTHMTEGLYSSDSGGAATFRRFLESELMPAVDNKFRTSEERILVGHSLAGLFVLDTFLERPHLFDAYIASDPSLWWDNNLLARKLEAQSGSPRGKSVRLYIAQANSPDATPGEHDAHKAGITAFRAALGAAKWPVRYSYQYFEDENHLSVPLQAIYRGLLFVFRDPASLEPTSARAPPNKSLEPTRER
jgi:predicted alpha/beta superfamily hydrolase